MLAFEGWLAGVLVWFTATVLRGKRDAFLFGTLVWGFVASAALHAPNWESWIVRHNVALASQGRPVDVHYFKELSLDAVPALAEALSGRRNVRLLDLSRSGAKLEGADLPSVGKDIVLRCAGLDTFGTIVWAEAEQCGIAFDEQIRLRDLVRLRDVAFAIDESDFTAEEIEAAADWTNGLAR